MTGEGAESASLGRWIHVVVRDGGAAGNALAAERRNLVAFLMRIRLSVMVQVVWQRRVALASRV